jgi:hypothetical protein
MKLYVTQELHLAQKVWSDVWTPVYLASDVEALESAAVASALRVKELEEMVLELEKECRGTCVFHIIKRRCESCRCPRSCKHS